MIFDCSSPGIFGDTHSTKAIFFTLFIRRSKKWIFQRIISFLLIKLILIQIPSILYLLNSVMIKLVLNHLLMHNFAILFILFCRIRKLRRVLIIILNLLKIFLIKISVIKLIKILQQAIPLWLLVTIKLLLLI